MSTVRRQAKGPEVCYFRTNALGLCNQLYAIAGALYQSEQSGARSVCVNGFSADMSSTDVLPLTRLLDVDASNQNFDGPKLVLANGPEMTKRVQRGRRANGFAVDKTRLRDILRQLVFADDITRCAESVRPDGTRFYCIHMRLGTDMVVFKHLGLRQYMRWVALLHSKNLDRARAQALEAIEKERNWIAECVQQCLNAIEQFCTDLALPIVVLTGIGKANTLNGLNDSMLWALEMLQNACPRAVCTKRFDSIGREWSAAVELCVATHPDCAGFIPAAGSTFSNTICMRLPSEKIFPVRVIV